MGKVSFGHLVDQVQVAGLQTAGDFAVARLIIPQQPPVQKRTALLFVNLMAVSDPQLESQLPLQLHYLGAVFQLLAEIIEEGFDLHFLLEEIGLGAVAALLDVLLPHCLHQILDVQGINFDDAVIGGQDEQPEVVEMGEMRLDPLEEIVEVLLERGRGGHKDGYAEDGALLKGLRRVYLLIVEERMDPSLQQIHQITFLLLLALYDAHVGVDLASLTLLQQIPDLRPVNHFY